MKTIEKKTTPLKLSAKNTGKKTPTKILSESEFWQQLALEQQAIIHAKNNT